MWTNLQNFPIHVIWALYIGVLLYPTLTIQASSILKRSANHLWNNSDVCRKKFGEWSPLYFCLLNNFVYLFVCFIQIISDWDKHNVIKNVYLQLMQNIWSNNQTPSYKGHLTIVVILSNSPRWPLLTGLTVLTCSGRPSCSWSHGSLIYNYLCNYCLSPPNLWIRISLNARCTRYNIMR